MSRGETFGLRSLLFLLFASLQACASNVAFVDRHADSIGGKVLRVATELGLHDRSTADHIIVDVPIEVRAPDGGITLDGCAIRVFQIAEGAGGRFRLDILSLLPGAEVELVDGSLPLVVPEGERRVMRVRFAAPTAALSSTGTTHALGFRLDETPAYRVRATDCPALADSDDFVQHYRISTFEPNSLGNGGVAVAGIFFLIAVLAASGR